MTTIRQEIIHQTASIIAASIQSECNADLSSIHKRAPLTATEETPPLPGKPWPGMGGIYVGIMRDDSRYWHLILATDPLSILNGEWGPEDTTIPGADSFTDGLANTQAMIEAGNNHPIIDQLIAYNKTGQDGHTDFYVPAQRENNLINLYAQEHVEKSWHWSNTQDDAYRAWCQDFEFGLQDIRNKVLSRAARAVRRILIIQ